MVTSAGLSKVKLTKRLYNDLVFILKRPPKIEVHHIALSSTCALFHDGNVGSNQHRTDFPKAIRAQIFPFNRLLNVEMIQLFVEFSNSTNRTVSVMNLFSVRNETRISNTWRIKRKHHRRYYRVITYVIGIRNSRYEVQSNTPPINSKDIPVGF